jgi:hypothetical protein
VVVRSAFEKEGHGVDCFRQRRIAYSTRLEEIKVALMLLM